MTLVSVFGKVGRKVEKFNFITDIAELPGLDDQEKEHLTQVTDRYPFRANSYYLSLIDWDYPLDPIRQLVIPNMHELEKWGQLDPSGEQDYTVVPGLEHKYDSTALLLVSDMCGGICRYCFRKRIFMHEKEEILSDLPAALDYLNRNKQITNVLLTGGDPLMLPTSELEKLINAIKQIDHIKIIRIGSKMPAYYPRRILKDKQLLQLFESCCSDKCQLHLITHFNHVQEITDIAVEAVGAVRKTGTVLANQTPLIRGVNDDAETLAELFNKLSFIGVPPYYLFQCRPAVGNKCFSVPVEQGYQIFEEAKSMVSGTAKRARYVMSHLTGKIEIVGLTKEHVHFKYHRAADNRNNSRFMTFPRNPQACWLDDYTKTL